MNTTDLVASPSILKGIARTVDLFGELDEYPEKSDEEQIRNDWEVAGETLTKTLETYDKKSRNS